MREVLECVKYTPSAENIQPWEIIIVSDADTCAELKDTLLDSFLREDDELKQGWMMNAPLVLVLGIGWVAVLMRKNLHQP